MSTCICREDSIFHYGSWYALALYLLVSRVGRINSTTMVTCHICMITCVVVAADSDLLCSVIWVALTSGWGNTISYPEASVDFD
jgi:hypothetical protein